VAKRHKLSKSSLHWFVKSRPFVLVPEIRRRFELDAGDEAWPIESPGGRAYVALPQRAARLLEDLVKEHRVGLELAPDLGARLVLGVYAFDLLKQPVGQVNTRPQAQETETAPRLEGDEERPVRPGLAARAPRSGAAAPRRDGAGRRSEPPGERRFQGPPRRQGQASGRPRQDGAQQQPRGAPPAVRRGERPDQPRPRPEGARDRSDRPRPRPN
jgi:hypothetical protein